MSSYLKTVILPIVFMLCTWTAEFIDALLCEQQEPTPLTHLQEVLEEVEAFEDWADESNLWDEKAETNSGFHVRID